MLLILALAAFIPIISGQRDATDLAFKFVHGVKKMSADEGEKFYWDYWQFDEVQPTGIVSNVSHSHARSYPFQPAVSLEQASWPASLLQRSFKCPGDTNACVSIGRPDRCCSTGDICQLVPDTGSGDVGCCPVGEVCSEVIGSCPWGYSTCSQDLGGGCCIPGYDCVPGGCVYISTVTVTVYSTEIESTSTYSTPRTSSGRSPSQSTESTGDLVPPARRTSLSTAVSSHEVSQTGYSGSMCPTGFYACSAVYQGGCCRTGRNCDTTSCPVIPKSTMISDGVTIAIPIPATTSEPGHCAQGWFSCADTAGGGCCPTGFACGSSCAATAGPSTVAKSPPQKGEGMRPHGKTKILELALVTAVTVMLNLSNT